MDLARADEAGATLQPTDSPQISKRLFASSTKQRRSELQLFLDGLKAGDLTSDEETTFLQQLLPTCSYYDDRASRQAACECLRQLVRSRHGARHLKTLIAFLKEELDKVVYAPSPLAVLVQWCSLALEELANAHAELWQDDGIVIMELQADLMEKALASLAGARPARQHMILVHSRSGMRRVARTKSLGRTAIQQAIQALTAKVASPRSGRAPFLGQLAGMCDRIPSMAALLREKAGDFTAFFVRELLGSRTALPTHVAHGLDSFFASSAISSDMFQHELAGPIHKALLRAPEVALDQLLPVTIKAISDDVDLSASLETHLLKPILSAVRSSNATVREGSLLAFEALAKHCGKSRVTNETAVEIARLLKDTKSAEHRAIYAHMISDISSRSSLNDALPLDIALVASKEANEQALDAEANLLASQLSATLSRHQPPNEALKKAFIQGLADKKPLNRRVWALRFGGLIRSLEPAAMLVPDVQNTLRDILMVMLKTNEDVVSNPAVAAQFGGALAAHIVIVVTLSIPALLEGPGRACMIVQNALGRDSKQSFLTNHRVYTKLNNQDDLLWTIRALATVAQDPDFIIDSAWAQAFIYMMTAASVMSSAHKEAKESLERLCLARQDVVLTAIIDGIWLWLKHIILEEKDTPAMLARTGRSRLYQVLRSLFIVFRHMSDAKKEEDVGFPHGYLIRLVVLCRTSLIPRSNWIQLCLRSGFDPQTVVSSMPALCMEEVASRARERLNAFDAEVFTAACDAAAELAFIDPESIVPLITTSLRADLDPAQLEHIGPTETAIFRTPEGTAFVDVLSTKPQERKLEKGNNKDYDVLKWEQEVRDQIARKSGEQRKLSEEDQTKLKAQLIKEGQIRGLVREVEQKLHRGIGYISSLTRGPPSDTEAWMAVASDNLISTIAAGAGLLVGDKAAFAYLACASMITPRLGSLRPFVGIATLRGQGISQLPNELTTEGLGDLITRILYRLRFNGEQRAFDSVSLIYIIPLIKLVLQRGGIGRSAGEDADEQITLAIEFLLHHADLFSGSNLPRESVLRLLVDSLRRFPQHYRLLKDCLLGISRAMAADASSAEIKVFLQGCTSAEAGVRNCVLQAIDNNLSLEDHKFCVEVWVAYHDSNEDNATLAETIWEENNLATDDDSTRSILPYLSDDGVSIRQAASRALAACIRTHPDCFETTLSALEMAYVEQVKARPLERDVYGMPKKVELKDAWQARQGIAMAFQALAPLYSANDLEPFIQFLIEEGPLADKDDRVRSAMVDAASSLITQRGEDQLEPLMALLERTIEAPDSGLPDHDLINEATIVMYGALASHLRSGDSRLSKVIGRLLQSLRIPSETVQYAIANCLPHLIQTSGFPSVDYVELVLDNLLNSKQYATRRGAAYGLAGIVKGAGLSSLRGLRILSSLKTAAEEKKDPIKRQGAFLAFELLSVLLGPIFEPYVIQIVPQILAGFGDTSTDVREACLDAAKTCFRTLSSFGVKQVLPVLLQGLDEQAWRSKKGACDSLGAMAYLDPQQLAVSLPEIIPPLTNVLNDSHKDVRGAANRSLQRFGDVINNPEIKGLVGILLKALSDPTKHTEDALDALLKVNFMHFLDAPSLALVVSILERGLGGRSQTKRKASQVIGSLAYLTERSDIVPHLPLLVSGLRVAAVDPVPSTRATSSKALGSIIEKLGEEALPDLVPSLMSTLKTDTGAGDRLGSAQALSEVLAGLGIARLEETLPSILQNVSSSKAAVREGFMSLFIFLPACFGTSFANYLSRVIPSILAGLADDVESIRETSLRAGRLLVKNFATKAIDLLLPELQRGLADDSHRIRLSSVELVGDLLFNLTGITIKEESDEMEDTAASAGQSLLEVLGEEKRNNILAALYISRCDTSGLVRTAAINVWKALVATPRTLREITPTLTQAIIRRLASSNMEQKLIASNALSELIRKAGDGVIASLLPTLEEGLETSVDIDSKQGICIALRELISSASEETLELYESKLVSVVRTALVDANPEVRDAAAQAFDSMQRICGKKMVEQILPYLLSLLREDESAKNALAALLTLLTEQMRANIILPTLLPTLLASPMSIFNANAIASLASVAGPAMTRRMKHVIESLFDNIIGCKDAARLQALNSALDAVLLSVDEFDGLNTMMSLMMGYIKHDDHLKRAVADEHIATFFSQADIDYSRYYADLIRVLLASLDDREPTVVIAASSALSTLTGRLRKEDMESLVISTRQSLRQVGVAGHHLAGFLIPKGINAILPIFLQGLINGTVDQRTQSALAISDIIGKTSGESLKPYVTQITGPLIRVVSERSTDVKAAILLTLNNLIEKIPNYVKPFLPQLQRTFTKALADTSSELLRTRAAKALGAVITLTSRVDPLIGELVNGSKTQDAGVKDAMQKALFEVVSKVGGNMSETSRAAVTALIDEETESGDDATAITSSRLLGALMKTLSPEVAGALVKARVLPSHLSKASVLALNAILLDSPTILTGTFPQETVTTIARGMDASETVVRENCVLAAGKYLLTETSNKGFEATRPLFEGLAATIHPGQSIDSRRLALVVIRTVSRENGELVRPHLPPLAQPIFHCVRDPIVPIKLAAEAAFMSIFDVEHEDSTIFDRYMAGSGADLGPGVKRSMQDYFKRVTLRLGAQAREKKEAEGGQNSLGLLNDEEDDIRELLSVGRVELSETSFDS